MERVTKKSKILFIRKQLSTNKVWCLKAMQKVLSFQTDGEKFCRETVEHNGVGFSQAHARVMTGILASYNTKGTLSDRQWSALLSIAPKYSEQILRVSDQVKLEEIMTGKDLGDRLRDYGKGLRIKKD